MFASRPPGPDAGSMSKRTAALRPALTLTDQQVLDARLLRRSGSAPEAIAEFLGCGVDEVEQALLAMRTPKADRSRGTLNVTLGAWQLVHRERRPDEAIHQTVDRLLRELEQRRAGDL